MRASPWPFLVGCGGSHGGTSEPTPLLRIARSDGGAFGTGADGSARLASYDATAKTAKVLSAAGATKVPVPGSPLLALAVTGDFLLATARLNEVDGTQIVDLRTLAARFDPGEAPRFVDGGRVVWTTASSPVVEDLATGVRTPVVLATNDGIVALRGTRLLVANAPPGGGDIREATAYRTTDLGGAKIADLALPSGDDYVEIDGLDDAGRAVGRAETGGLVGFPFPYPETPYLWSATGVPSPLPTGVSATSLSLADDGTVLAIDDAERLHLLRDGIWRSLGVTALPAVISPDGRTVLAAYGDEDGVAAYGVGA